MTLKIKSSIWVCTPHWSSLEHQKNFVDSSKNLATNGEDFDVRSSENFQELIHFLRAQRLIQRRKQFQVEFRTKQRNVEVSTLMFWRKNFPSVRINVRWTRPKNGEKNLFFSSVRQAIETSAFTIRPENDLNCDLLWVETKIPLKILPTLKSYQKINQFVEMNEIAEKNLFFKHYPK